MKRYAAFWGILAACTLLASCASPAASGALSPQTVSAPESAAPESSLPDAVSAKDNGDLEAVKAEMIAALAVQEGWSREQTASFEEYPLMLTQTETGPLTTSRNGTVELYQFYPGAAIPVMRVTDGDKRYYRIIPAGMTSGARFSLGDLDGDGLCEIVTTALPGDAASATLTPLVWKVTDDLEVLWSSAGQSAPLTGFSVQAGPGEHQYTVSNGFTGLCAVYDYAGAPGGAPVREGLVKKPFRFGQAERTAFLEFAACDPDADGVFEIAAMESMDYGMDNNDFWGTRFSLLRYDPTGNRFRVIDAAFLPMREGEDDYFEKRDAFFQQWRAPG